MSLIRRHLTFANVAATLALVVALSGAAYAAGLPKNSVTSPTIKNGAVKSVDLKDDDVTGADVKESTLAAVPNATNAGSLGGATAQALRRITVPITSAGLGGDASVSTDSVNFGPVTGGAAGWSFVVPQNHKPGDELEVEVRYIHASGGGAACSWVVEAGGQVAPPGGDRSFISWKIPGATTNPAPIALAAAPSVDRMYSSVFRLETPVLPGGLVNIYLQRNTGDPADTCLGGINLFGIEFRY